MIAMSTKKSTPARYHNALGLLAAMEGALRTGRRRRLEMGGALRQEPPHVALEE